MHASDIVHRFLTSIGRPSEARYYLDLFRSEQPEQFALIQVAPDIAVEVGALMVDLSFLTALGLCPAVVCSSAEERDAIAASGTAPTVAADSGEAAQVIRAGKIPVIAASGLAPLTRLADSLHSRKIVFLTPASGLAPVGGPVCSLADITHDYHELLMRLPPGQAQLLADARSLIQAVPHRMTVAITSPLDLLRELFTTKGAGTLVRRGARVHSHADLGELDRGAFHRLITSSFGREPLPDFYQRAPQAIYIADDYRGAALVEARPLCAYLSKFAVDLGARGEGIGGDLWRVLTRNHPRLLWRCRPDNPINGWYQQQCDGLVRTSRWDVFWRGLQPGEIAEAVDTALAAVEDFPAAHARD